MKSILLSLAAASTALLASCVHTSPTPALTTQTYQTMPDTTQAAKLGGDWYYRHGSMAPAPNPFIAVDAPGKGEVFWGHGPVRSNVYALAQRRDGSERPVLTGRHYYRFGETYYLPLPRR